MNFLTLPCHEGKVHLGSLTLHAPSPAPTVVLGIRAEDIDFADPGVLFTVRVAEPLGVHTLLTGTVDGQLVRVTAAPDARPAAGETMMIRPRQDRITWLAADTGHALEPQ